MEVHSKSGVLPMEPLTGSDGSKYLYCKTQSGLTADTPCQIQPYSDGTDVGYFATAIADSVAGSITSFAAYIGIPRNGKAVASGSAAWVQYQGKYDNAQFSAAGVSGSIGHALEQSVAVVFCRGSVYNGAQQMFGILTEELSASTTANIFLTGKLCAGTS